MKKELLRSLKNLNLGRQKGGPYFVDNLIEVISANYTGFDAIGISTASQVNSEEGSIIYANENFPGYTGMNIKAIFEAEFGVPVKIENDVNRLL